MFRKGCLLHYVPTWPWRSSVQGLCQLPLLAKARLTVTWWAFSAGIVSNGRPALLHCYELVGGDLILSFIVLKIGVGPSLPQIWSSLLFVAFHKTDISIMGSVCMRFPPNFSSSDLALVSDIQKTTRSSVLLLFFSYSESKERKSPPFFRG